MPPKKLRGTETTSAQGQDTTRKISARLIHMDQLPVKSGGTRASSTAPMTTTGVYQRAKRVMKLSTLAFFSAEFSTSSRIRETVLSAKALSVRTFSTPERLMEPLMTRSPTVTSTGRLSPVSAAVSRLPLPSSTVPSRGIRSPGRITMVSPTATSSGSTVCSCPSRSTTALSGRISMSAAMDLRLRPTAMDWNHSPIW